MSVIVPELDLAPSVTSRVVTIDVIDMQEGAPAGGSVDFILAADLHVPADDKIIQAGSVTVTLDAAGHGEVRLPTYDPDVRPDGWGILVKKSWAPHPYLIRVPEGTTKISLADIEPVQEADPSLASWLLTGAAVSVVEGAQWGASVTTTGGVARFVFTVPPGGEAWSKGALTASSVLDTLAAGVYRVQAGSVATALGLPVIRVGTLQVTDVSSTVRVQTFTTNDQNDTTSLQMWSRSQTNTGTWRPWRRLYPDDKAYLQWSSLAGTEDLGALEPGIYWVSSGTAATALALPVVRIGRIEIHRNAANGQRSITFTTNDVNAGAPLQIWARATDQDALWTGPWRRVYPLDLPASTGESGATGALLLEDLYTRRGGAVRTDGATPVALVFDDYPRAYRDVVRPLLVARGLSATLALGSRQYEPSSTRIYDGAVGTTWAEIDAWAETEIANHGATHAYIGDDIAALHDEIVQGLTELQAALPSKTISCWVQPASGYGPFNDGDSLTAWGSTTAGKMILANHALGTGTRRFDGALTVPRHGRPYQGMGRLWFDSPAGLAAAQTEITTATGTGRGILLGSHAIRIDEVDRITSAELATFLDWLVAEQTAGRVRIVTLSEWAIADARTP